MHSIAWDAHRYLIFAGAADHTVSVNDAVTGQVLHQLKVHANCISAVVYFPGGTQLIAFDFDGRATVYSHDFEVTRVQQVSQSPVSCARGWFKDGWNRVVTGSWCSQVRWERIVWGGGGGEVCVGWWLGVHPLTNCPPSSLHLFTCGL